VKLTAAKLTNSFSHEPGYYCAVDTAGDGANDLGFVTDLLADTFDRVLDEVAHDPMLTSFADVDGKVLENFSSAGSVRDFGVELNTCRGSGQIILERPQKVKPSCRQVPTINWLGLVGNSSVLRILRAGDPEKILGQPNQFVKVAHVDCSHVRLMSFFYTKDSEVLWTWK
jgi:hypothetical protein